MSVHFFGPVEEENLLKHIAIRTYDFGFDQSTYEVERGRKNNE
jgi:hypothetical protein